MIKGLAAVFVFGSLLHPARVTFWQSNSGEFDFVIKDHLGGDHDRVCGIVSQDADGTLWDSLTFKSGGAHKGMAKNNLPLDAAKLAVEQDCR
jgi:hypothetical protein